jgi:hypothetical protein
VSCTLLPHPAGQCLPTPTSLTMGMIACGEASGFIGGEEEEEEEVALPFLLY